MMSDMRQDQPRGRRSRALPAAAVLLAAAALGCGGNPSSEPAGRDEAGQGGAPAASVDAVQVFDDFAAGIEPSERMEPSTIAEGLRGLAGAIGTLGVAPPEVLVDLRVAPEHVLLNPESPEVAATVREALLSAGQALASTESGKGSAVEKAAEGIRADTPLPDQGAALSTFFQEAARALGRPAAP